MALSRRSGQRFEANIWPGFVDALTALLLILMFVLSIFMIVQFSLRETITGQSKELNDLNAQLSALTDVLALERTKSEGLESELGTVRASLAGERQETDRLTAALAAMTNRFEGATAGAARLSAALAALNQEKADLEGQLADTRSTLDETRTELSATISARDAVGEALAQARDEIDAQTEAARLAAARREAMQALIADLQSETRARSAEVDVLTSDKASALALIAALETEAQSRAEALEQSTADAARLERERAAIEADRAAQEATVGELEAVRARLEQDLAALEVEKAALEADLDTARARLTEEEQTRLIEAAAAEALRKKLENDAAELDAITLALEEARADAEQTLTLLAAAEAARQRLDDDLRSQGQTLAGLQVLLDEEQRRRRDAEAAAGGVTDAFDREEALRKIAEAELAKANEQTAEQARRVALLNQQVKELNTQLASLQALLDTSAARETADQVQISNLGSQLNAALARKVALEAENADLLAEQVDRLEEVRSIFLERVSEALAGREGIKQVGDRFVFQSEVLFNAGSAELGRAGQIELTKLGAVMRDIAGDLPSDLDWVLRVDGHTDKLPLSGFGRYRNNWELSQARALSVVSYLIDREGADPSRLAAAGFGEFQPLDEGESSDALARNRRIEFKFTER
ncbi:MAG: peptidoglycan -binding protein [Pseudomonadota bacterium]